MRKNLYLRACIVALSGLVLGACEPQIDAESAEERLRAVERIDDQAVLTEVALNGRGAEVQMAAVRKINDPEALRTIAIDGLGAWVRIEATAKISDQSVLQEIVQSTQQWQSDVATAAIERLTDQAILLDLLTSPRFKHLGRSIVDQLQLSPEPKQQTYAEIAIKTGSASAYRLVTDEDLLKDILLRSHLDDVAIHQNLSHEYAVRSERQKIIRRDVIDRISTPEILADIAQQSEVLSFKRMARERLRTFDPVTADRIQGRTEKTEKESPSLAAARALTDEAALLDHASRYPDRQASRYIVERLTDTELLKQFALKTRHHTDKAIAKLDGEDMLVDIVENARSDDARGYAFAKIKSEENIARLLVSATRQSRVSIRDEAIIHEGLMSLRNADTLKRVAHETPDTEVRAHAEAMIKVVESTEVKDVIDLALNAVSPYARLASVERIQAEHYLQQVALKDTKNFVGRTAVEKITDQFMLAEIAQKASTTSTKEFAVAQISDESQLARIALQARWTHEAMGALKRIQSPRERLHVFLNAKENAVRADALLGTRYPPLLPKVIEKKSEHSVVRVMAIRLLDDEDYKMRITAELPQAHLREAAIEGIRDESFLLARLDQDPSPSVRAAALEQLSSTKAILKAAQSAYYQLIRSQAFERLQKLDAPEDQIQAARDAHRALAKEVKNLSLGIEPAVLISTAVSGRADVVAAAAALALTDDESLAQVASRAQDRNVLKIAFSRLRSQPALVELATTASTPEMRLAALVKAQKKDWQIIFKEAREDAHALGNALAAVSLFDSVQLEAQEPVEQAALFMIRQGNESRIPEMTDILDLYGNKKLAEDFMNCGQNDLGTAGKTWARSHGYSVSTGFGSSRARWGN